MALLFMDSFDHYASGDVLEKYSAASGVSISLNGRRGTSAATIAHLGSITRSLAPASTTAIVGVALDPAGLSVSPRIDILSSATVQASVAFTTAGYAVAQRGTSTVLGTATTLPITAGTFAYVEIKVVVHPSAGSFVIRINGVEVLNLTSVNTAATGAAAWDAVSLGGTFNNPKYDDLYVLDGSGAAPLNTFLGDCRVDPRYPTGAGATTGWTPSTAPNWSCVDDAAPNDDTDYVSAAAASGVKDTYAVQDAPVAGGTLYGVQLLWNIKKLDSGTCSVAPVVRHSGTDQIGTAQDPGLTYAYGRQAYGTNPGTGAAWVEADFNAAEFGVSRTA